VVAIGEAKYTNRPRTNADLARLEHIRTLLATRGDATLSTKLLLFSASGFDRNLTGVAEGRGDIELIDLDRMYNSR
jgi:hypothetical protein